MQIKLKIIFNRYILLIRVGLRLPIYNKFFGFLGPKFELDVITQIGKRTKFIFKI
jgi:hypothetical protein